MNINQTLQVVIPAYVEMTTVLYKWAFKEVLQRSDAV